MIPPAIPSFADSTAIVATPAANHARRRGFVRNPSLTVTSSSSASVRKRILRLPDSKMEPLRLEPTRVYRFYRGGAQLARFRGGEAEDGSFPEDWVCSVTGATNAGRQQADEGLTRLEDGRLLREAVAQEPEAWLGRAHVERFGVTTGLLVKLLDPAERILVHTHPDRAFAASHLGSEFGKTEAWIVLATREGAGEAFVGLREAVEPAEDRAARGRAAHCGHARPARRDQAPRRRLRAEHGHGAVAVRPAGLGGRQGRDRRLRRLRPRTLGRPRNRRARRAAGQHGADLLDGRAGRCGRRAEG